MLQIMGRRPNQDTYDVDVEEYFTATPEDPTNRAAWRRLLQLRRETGTDGLYPGWSFKLMEVKCECPHGDDALAENHWYECPVPYASHPRGQGVSW